MLTSEQIKEICSSLKGSTFELKEEWGSELGRISGKIFAMYGRDSMKNRIITLKVNPLEGERLRSMYPSWIKEGYYMNKLHWISVELDESSDDNLVIDLIHQSYQLVFSSLSKKVRELIALAE